MRALLVVVLVAGCSPPPAPSPAPPASSRPVAAAVVVDAGPNRPEAAAIAEPEPPEPSFEEIHRVMGISPSACPSSLLPEPRIRCLYDQRYAGDAKAAGLAHELWVKWKIVAGVEAPHTMDGGYRGMIKIEPAVPINGDRKHLEWIVAAMHDFEKFFANLERAGADAGAAGKGRRYRWRPITIRFMRSVGMRTPSAYANDWTVAWNLNGSLHVSAEAARETLFHELFHLNDYEHATPSGQPWSVPVLGPAYDEIVKKCGASTPCLGPFTPNDTMVRNGTYYSFQPGNDVREYAAELALRYYRDQRNHFEKTPGPKPPFKCTSADRNKRAWDLMKDEFFSGIDAIPPCP